jgi:tripartite-type tricarboxylate transporter receptor subunit TctC
MNRALPAVALCLSLSLTACGGGETATQGGSGSGDQAASYPEQGDRIQMLIGLSAGGTTDTWARILAEALSEQTGARFQVVNMPGAGGQLAINEVLSAPEDTSQVANVNLPSALKYLYPNSQATYTREDFAPAGCTGYTPNVLVVRADSPYQSLQDLVEEAKSRPGKLNAAADGALSDDTVAYANFEEAAGVDVNVVVVDGSAEKVTALLGEQVDFFTGGLTGVRAQVESGDFRVLAVLAEEPSPFLEGVPTAIEQGVELLSDSYFCFAFAQRAPEEARAGLEEAMREVSQDPAYEEANAEVGMEVRFLSGDEMAQEWARQEDVVREVIENLQ